MNVQTPKTPADRAAEAHRPAALDEVLRIMERRRDVDQPVLDYLRDK